MLWDPERSGAAGQTDMVLGTTPAATPAQG
jgi:hypothetical protein